MERVVGPHATAEALDDVALAPDDRAVTGNEFRAPGEPPRGPAGRSHDLDRVSSRLRNEHQGVAGNRDTCWQKEGCRTTHRGHQVHRLGCQGERRRA